MHYRLPAACLLAAVLLVAATAPAAPSLPAQATADPIVMMLYVDLARLDAKQLAATAKTILGEHADIMDQPIKQLEQRKTRFIDAGGQALLLLFTMDAERKRPNDPIMLASHKADANLEALGEGAAVVVDGRPAKMRTTAASPGWAHADPGEGSWRAPALPAAPAAAGPRQALFAAAIKEIGDAPVFAVIVPDDALREALAPPPTDRPAQPGMPDMEGTARSVIQAEWLAVWAAVGDQPALKAVARMPDADSAKKAADAINALSQAMEQLAKTGLAGMPMPRALGPLMLLQSVRVTAADTKVVLDMKTQDLTKAGQALGGALVSARNAAKATAAMSNMRQLLVAVQMYANDNEGKLPDNLDQLKKYLGTDEAFARITTNPRTGDKPGYLYTKPAAKMAEVKNPATTPMVQELKGGKVDPEGATGYVDGHVERPRPGGAPKPPPGTF